MIVAIDGPSGAGKSTVAKAVAKELGFSCLDTGAMYRAIAWRALQDGVALDDESALGAIARTYDIAFGHVEGDPVPRRVFIGDDEVTDAIRTAEIDRAVRMLKRQELVGILPEGTRRGKTDRVPSIHAGVSVIARMAKVPILPMTVRGVERIKQKGQRVHFPKVTVDYGDPILVGDFDFLPKDERVEACTWYAMRECFALYYRCAPEDVDMAALFPETRDYAPVFAEHPIPRHTSEELARAARTARAERAAKAAAKAKES